MVHLGELTELGACFLGWDEGPKEVFAAVIRSCFRFSKGFALPGMKRDVVPQERDEDDEDEETRAPLSDPEPHPMMQFRSRSGSFQKSESCDFET